MKVLLDEMLPIGVREPLPGHDVPTAALTAGFDVLVSLDRGIPQQQNLARHAFGFILIPDNDVDLIRRYAARLLSAVDAATPRTVVRIERADDSWSCGA